MNSWADKKKHVSLSSPSNSFDGMVTAALLINLPDEAQRGGCRFFLRGLKARIVNHLLEMLEDDAALFVRQLHLDGDLRGGSNSFRWGAPFIYP